MRQEHGRAEKARTFNPTEVPDAERAEEPEPGSISIGRPISPRKFADLKKRAATEAIEPGFGQEDSPA